jgi:hypothetical protein
MFSTWKLIPTALVAGTLLLGLTARPPRAPVPAGELIRLVIVVTALYLVGAVALLDHRTPLAVIVFATGLALCGLAVWLSRGDNPPSQDDGDGGGGQQPPHQPTPPPDCDFDWSFYEEQFREPVA